MPTKTTKTTSTRKSTPAVVDPFENEDAIGYTAEDQEEFVIFKRSHFYSVLVVLAFAVGILLGYVIWGRGTNAVPTVAAEAEPAQAAAQPSGPVVEAPITPEVPRYDIPTEGYPSIGPDDAPITIVEFSDYQCPYCRRFHQETFQALLDAYPGQIRFVYRNLPVTGGNEPMNSAMAALCANEQGMYWEYHDKLFSSDVLGRDIYLQYADELDLDIEEFTACYESGRHEETIAADVSFSSDIGIQSTPTFFINGLAIIGAQPLSAFQQIIDQELAGEIP